jgi:acetyl esterase/lipase
MKKYVLYFSLIFITACQKDISSDPQVAPLPAQTISNVSYGSDAKQKMDIYLPASRNTDSTKVIVLVHGGAWIEGDKGDFDPLVLSFKQLFPDYAIANINYRLATVASNHFPAQETDMKAAVDFLVQKSGEYKIAQKFVLMGASAGAHMALLQAYKNNSPKIKAVVDFFGPVDMPALYNSITNPASLFAFQVLMGGTPTANPLLYQQSSPINFVTAQSPPTIIFHGEADDLVALSQSVQLKTKLQSMGVVNQLVIYPNQGHELWPPQIMADAFAKIEVFIKANVR